MPPLEPRVIELLEFSCSTFVVAFQAWLHCWPEIGSSVQIRPLELLVATSPGLTGGSEIVPCWAGQYRCVFAFCSHLAPDADLGRPSS